MDSLNSVSDRLKLGASVLLNYTSYRGNLLHRLPLNARTLRKEIRVFLTKLAVWVESTAYKGRTDILGTRGLIMYQSVFGFLVDVDGLTGILFLRESLIGNFGFKTPFFQNDFT